MNVRLHRKDGWTLMDTFGLAPFGLPDLQCRFGGRDPGSVGSHLVAYARYLLSRGDVLADGDTVDAVRPGERWECHRTVALAGPDREVIDLTPSEPIRMSA